MFVCIEEGTSGIISFFLFVYKRLFKYGKDINEKHSRRQEQEMLQDMLSPLILTSNIRCDKKNR